MKPNYRAAFGHNPLGALSVVAILLALITQVTLGLFASDTDGLESGPLSRYVDYEFAKDAGDLHEDFFNVLLVLIGLHIAAIVFYLVVKRTNLIGPMLTGSAGARRMPRGRRAASRPCRCGGLRSAWCWRWRWCGWCVR